MLNYLMTTGRPENELIDKLQQKAEKKGYAQGFAKGKAEAAAQIVRYLKQAGYKLKAISKYTAIPLEELKKL
ncbi:MAG: hypothetical protein ACSW73_03220 [Spirochaetales bacterium]